MTNEELVIEYQTGNKAVIEQLYLQNRGMIERIARRYCEAVELEDLRQESYFGLVKAAELWNKEKETAFITYAVYWIKATIHRYIENCGGVIRIPTHKRAQIGSYHKAVNTYQLSFGRYPSERELCAALDINPEQLKELEKDIQSVRIRSTSEQIGGDNEDLTLEDTLAAEGDAIGEVIEQIQHEELAAELWDCVDCLKPERAGVIRGLYKEGKTLKQCGDDLCISAERARQIKGDAIKELRKTHYTKRLLPYLDESAARSWGMSGTGYRTFLRYGSVQERTLMKLEEITGMSLYNGVEFPDSNQ